MLKDYVIKMLERISELASSVYGWIVLVLCQFLAIDGVQTSLILLLIMFTIDYVTGLSAAWKEGKENDAPFFIESKKIRQSILKACTYLLFIFMSWMMWYLFFDGTVHLPVSTKEVNIISITIGICMAVEMWSVLENMKRLGFDLLAKVRKTFSGFWKAYKNISHHE